MRRETKRADKVKFAHLFFSDMKVKLENGDRINAHKFVLNARNPIWDNVSLESSNELDWSDLPNDVGFALLKWIYTDKIALLDKDDTFKLSLMKTSKRFNLPDLMLVCERALVSSVHIRNCIKFYTTAEEIGANELKNHCSRLISTHWVLQLLFILHVHIFPSILLFLI